MTPDHYIEDSSLSIAWGKAIKLASARGSKEVVPLIVSITGFDSVGNVKEEPTIRASLDSLLIKENQQSIETVASTIFPYSMWNPAAGRAQLFQRYKRALSRIIKASSKNRRGLYFERMIQGGPPTNPNQLDFALTNFTARKSVRRSMLQIGIFDPTRDHSNAAQLGFPCLQHVTFSPVDGGLSVNAFYATQYLVERAYGNYLGICRLGQFVAHELGLKLVRVTCYAGIAECDIEKNKLSPSLAIINTFTTPP